MIPQFFWHQGLVSCKTIFPPSRVRGEEWEAESGAQATMRAASTDQEEGGWDPCSRQYWKPGQLPSPNGLWPEYSGPWHLPWANQQGLQCQSSVLGMHAGPF